MARHELKTWPEFYADIITGRKKFELRRDDRGYRQGDTLVLREWDPKLNGYTGNATTVKVTHILRDAPDFGLDFGYCIMSITPPLS